MMIKKTFMKSGNNCRVTFKITAENTATEIALVGEFNNWDDSRHIFTRRKDGSFSTTVTLKTGQDYRFKYLVDKSTWMNESDADSELPNTFGTKDSVISL